MKYLFAILLFIIFGCDQKPVRLVEITTGKIEGVYHLDKQILSFKGIPYARPPIGDLRWVAPQPVVPWDTIMQCKEFSASPIQNKPVPFYSWTEEFIAKPEPLSEDCLYLNVWTSTLSKEEKLPVFVWIYGGGLVSGSSNCAIYDGGEMAKQGLVFVSLNYRVGALGFMAHPALSANSPYKTSGNYGFLDQIAALQWIQQNISAFGGDPDNVTIAGQSAGSFSVNTLIASPLAKGLFHKTIMQSGGLLSNRFHQQLDEAEAMGERLMKVAGANSIEELKAIPAKDLQIMANDTAIGRFGVTLDNYLLPSDLLQHFSAGRHQQLPLLAGWVTGDGSFMGASKMSVDEYEEEARSLYEDQADDYLSLFPARNEQEVQEMKSKQTLIHFAGMPAHLLATFNTQASYIYEFGHVPPDKAGFPNYGAFHTSEVPFVLHNLHTWNRPWRPVDREIEKKLSAYWVNFAKTGNPNGDNLPEWKSYQKDTGYVLRINESISSQTGYMKAFFDFFEAYQ